MLAAIASLPGKPVWKTLTLLFGLLTLPAHADRPSSEAVTSADRGTSLPEIGMSMSAARELLFNHSMNEELIGGACGMLQILSSEDNSIRIIGVGGVVTSISEKKKPLALIEDDKNSSIQNTSPNKGDVSD